jgi:hypothetical protein
MIPRSEQLRFLVSRKYPGSISSAGGVGVGAATSCLLSLSALPVGGLAAAYEAERAEQCRAARLREEELEADRFFNQPAARADVAYWSIMADWDVAEAVALSFGLDPRRVNRDTLRPFARVSAFAALFASRTALAERAVRVGQLSDPTWPGHFLKWAERLGLPVPEELVDAVRVRGVQISDWRSEFEQMRTKHDEQLARVSDLTAAKDEEIRALRAEIERLRALPGRWPWGSYETPLLRALAQAAGKFWVNYDSADHTTAPRSHDVEEWLEAQDIAKRAAAIMAQMLRDPAVKPGPR